MSSVFANLNGGFAARGDNLQFDLPQEVRDALLREEMRRALSIRQGPGDVNISTISAQAGQVEEADLQAFAFMNAFPVVMHPTQSLTYPVWENPLAARMEPVGPTAEYPEVQRSIEMKTSVANPHGGRYYISDQVIRNQAQSVNAMRAAIRTVVQAAFQAVEDRFTQDFFQDGVARANAGWTYFGTGGGSAANATLDVSNATLANHQLRNWNESDATPIRDVSRILRVVHRNTGYKPNVMIIGPGVYDALITNSTILNRINQGQTSGTAVVNLMVLAAVFGVDRVVVASARRSASTYYNEDGVLFLVAPATKSADTVSAGMTHIWEIGANTLGGNVMQWRSERRKSDVVDGDVAFNLAQQSNRLGCLLTNVVG